MLMPRLSFSRSPLLVHFFIKCLENNTVNALHPKPCQSQILECSRVIQIIFKETEKWLSQCQHPECAPP